MKNLLFVWIVVVSIIVGMVGIAKAVVPSPPDIQSVYDIDTSGFKVKIKKTSDALYYITSVYIDRNLSALASGSINGVFYDRLEAIPIFPAESNEFSIEVSGLAGIDVYYFFGISAINLDGLSLEMIDRAYIRPNRSTGRFEVAQVLKGANYVDAGDIDGDGDVDIIGLSYDLDQLSWYSNDGSGNYSVSGVSIGGSSADKFVLFDADGDGDLDIVCGYSVPFDYFFSSEGKSRVLSLFTNDGSGNFTKSNIVTDSYLAPVDIKTGDMDGDGLDDIIIANAWDRNPVYNTRYGSSSVSITGMYCLPVWAEYYTNRNSEYETELTNYYTHCWLPIDHDDKLNGKLVWLKNLGDGLFDREEVVGSINITPVDNGKGGYNRHNPRRYRYGALDVGDIDFDGDMDIVTAINTEIGEYYGRVRNQAYDRNRYMIYRNDGSAVFSKEQFGYYNGENHANIMKLEDVGGSYDLDLIVGAKIPYGRRFGINHFLYSKINFRLLNENFGASFGSRSTISTLGDGQNSRATILEVEDFDGNGVKDYAIATSRGKSIKIGSSKVSGIAGDHYFVSGSALDIDGDSDWDFVGGTSSGDTFFVMRNIDLEVVANLETPVVDVADQIGSDSFRTRWEKITGDNIVYEIQVSKSTNFKSLVSGYTKLDVGDVDSHVANGLSSSTQYYYRVRAKDTSLNVYSKYSSYSPCITAPARVDALAGNSLSRLGFLSRWSVVSGSGYELEVSTNIDFSSSSLLSGYDPLLIDDDSINSRLVVKDGSDLSKSYYYRVRSYVSGIVGDASDYIVYGSYSDTVLVLGIPTIEDLVKDGVGEVMLHILLVGVLCLLRIHLNWRYLIVIIFLTVYCLILMVMRRIS